VQLVAPALPVAVGGSSLPALPCASPPGTYMALGQLLGRSALVLPVHTAMVMLWSITYSGNLHPELYGPWAAVGRISSDSAVGLIGGIAVVIHWSFTVTQPWSCTGPASDIDITKQPFIYHL
jgi:hypothetical protein